MSRIARLPISAIAALQQVPGVRLADLQPQVRQALIVAGLSRHLGLALDAGEAKDLESQPFALIAEDQRAILDIHVGAGRMSGLGQPLYHQWAGGLEAAGIVFDCHRLEHVNSVLIAWMLQIVQAAKPTPVQVRRAKPQVATQLKQLRLDHLMAIA